jgi:hypothetical protein
MKIVALGMCCRVSWMLQSLNLKGENSMFEWMRSVNFEDILKMLRKIANGESIEIQERSTLKGNVFLDNTEIHTCHYNKIQLEEKFKRRSERFIEYIKSSDKILFIREDFNDYPTKKNQIIEFKNIIEKINPNCDYKILLLSAKQDDLLNKIDIEKVKHILHTPDKEKYLEFINSDF